MIEKLTKYRKMIIVILGAIAAIATIVNQSAKDIDSEITKIDSVIKVTIDTNKLDSIK